MKCTPLVVKSTFEFMLYFVKTKTTEWHRIYERNNVLANESMSKRSCRNRISFSILQDFPAFPVI